MQDDQISQLIESEKQRQLNGLDLIPSENYVSPDVLDALGSVFTNKYSEGYPGRRYYGGQEFTDQVEQLAIDRARQLFGADHANVQPHSGASANEAVYAAWLEPGDKVLAMELSHGGHLTHGAPVTRSANLYEFIRYKSLGGSEIDYGELKRLALEHKPKIILAGFSSFTGKLDYAKFSAIGREVGALLMADMAHMAGLIAGGVADNPLDYGFNVMTATTHKTLRGPRGGLILSKGTVSNPMVKPEKTIGNIPTLIDRAVFPGIQGGPHMHAVAAKAVAFGEALRPEFRQYAARVLENARALAEELKARGFKLTGDGTSNHMILINVKSSFDIDGKTAEKALEAIGLTANANVIPDDTLPPMKPSGLRLGTPAMTTRGLQVEHMSQIAAWCKQAIVLRDQPDELKNLREEVRVLAIKFPPPVN